MAHTHTHTHTRRTPPDEGSVRRRDLYLTLTKDKRPYPGAGFGPAIATSERPRSHRDRSNYFIARCQVSRQFYVSWIWSHSGLMDVFVYFGTDILLLFRVIFTSSSSWEFISEKSLKHELMNATVVLVSSSSVWLSCFFSTPR